MLIVQTATAADLDDVRQLLREFVIWHRRTHVDDLPLIDRYFDAAAFESELASLPGPYGSPDGVLLLARVDGRAAGCVALQSLGANAR